MSVTVVLRPFLGDQVQVLTLRLLPLHKFGCTFMDLTMLRLMPLSVHHYPIHPQPHASRARRRRPKLVGHRWPRVGPMSLHPLFGRLVDIRDLAAAQHLPRRGQRPHKAVARARRNDRISSAGSGNPIRRGLAQLVGVHSQHPPGRPFLLDQRTNGALDTSRTLAHKCFLRERLNTPATIQETLTEGHGCLRSNGV